MHIRPLHGVRRISQRRLKLSTFFPGPGGALPNHQTHFGAFWGKNNTFRDTNHTQTFIHLKPVTPERQDGVRKVLQLDTLD